MHAVAFSSGSQGCGSGALGREQVVVLPEHEPVLGLDVASASSSSGST